MTAVLIDAGHAAALLLTGRLDLPADVRFLAAWAEGGTARLSGSPSSANPYVPDTISGWGWACGWSDTDPLVSALIAHADQGPAS